jgi:sugar-specific transcriptional regulator TrmB
MSYNEVMFADTDMMRKYFEKLGLEPEIADLYMSLYSNGPQSISELSRTSGVERTRIYRLIDQLLASNLIAVEQSGTRGIIKAAPISNLRTLITEREQATKNLSDDLELLEKVLSRNSLSSPGVRVQFHYGPEGVRQMLGHELQSKTEIICYLHPSVRGAAGTRFMDGWHRDFEANSLSRRALGNNLSIGPTPTNKNTARRNIDPEKYMITHRMAIYDDTVAYYLWNGSQAYGIELQNKEIAGRERQLFEILWSQSTP